MNYTSKNNSAPQISIPAIGLPVRNIFLSLISLFLLSFFAVGVKAQHINNHKQQPVIINQNSVVSKTLAVITSTSTGGLWSATSTWVGGVVPTATDVVTIASGAPVTVDANSTCLSITINGTLTFNAGINLDVNGNWINIGSVGFTGRTLANPTCNITGVISACIGTNNTYTV